MLFRFPLPFVLGVLIYRSMRPKMALSWPNTIVIGMECERQRNGVQRHSFSLFS